MNRQDSCVTAEIAMSLKKKGFRCECDYHYEVALTTQVNEQDGETGPFGWRKGETIFTSGYFVNGWKYDLSNENWSIAGAPHWSDVIDWFRKEHKIYVEVEKTGFDNDEFMVKIRRFNKHSRLCAAKQYSVFKTFELTREKAILQALTLI